MTGFIYAIIALSVLIIVHEFGHFITARLVNVKVITFSLGFGKKLLSWKKGENRIRHLRHASRRICEASASHLMKKYRKRKRTFLYEQVTLPAVPHCLRRAVF